MTTVKAVGSGTVDVVVKTPQPTIPATAVPPRIGLVEITKIETAETAESILAKLLTVDGAASGLDADLLDGQHGTYYSDYNNLANKPSSFPPALPIQQSDVINLVSDQAAQDSRLTAVESKNTAQDGNLTTINADQVTQNNRLTAVEGVNATQDTAISTNTTNIAANTSAIATKIGEAPNDGQQYARKSLAWSVVTGTGGGGAATSISDTAPGSPVAGQLWWESDTGNLYIWYNDGNSSQWVQVNVAGTTTPKISVGTSAPTSPSVNDLWVDTN